MNEGVSEATAFPWAPLCPGSHLASAACGEQQTPAAKERHTQCQGLGADVRSLQHGRGVLLRRPGARTHTEQTHTCHLTRVKWVQVGNRWQSRVPPPTVRQKPGIGGGEMPRAPHCCSQSGHSSRHLPGSSPPGPQHCLRACELLCETGFSCIGTQLPTTPITSTNPIL